MTVIPLPGANFTADLQGVYSCVIPDENGVQQTVDFGLYPHGYTTSEHVMITSIISGLRTSCSEDTPLIRTSCSEDTKIPFLPINPLTTNDGYTRHDLSIS